MDLIIKQLLLIKQGSLFPATKGVQVLLVAKIGEPHSEHAVGNTKHILAHLYLLRWRSGSADKNRSDNI